MRSDAERAGLGVPQECIRAMHESGYPRVMRLAMALTFTVFAATAAAQQTGPSGGDSRSWDPAAAAAYLDARMDLWFANGTKLRTGDTQTACVSCHAGLAYALSDRKSTRLNSSH